jgi:hypothetical protein
MLCESFINYTQTSPLQEHPTRGTTPIASLRAHAAGRLTLKCGGQHGPRAVLPQRPQSLREQRAVGFLEDLSQGVNSQWVHMFPSLTPSECPRTRPGVQRPGRHILGTAHRSWASSRTPWIPPRRWCALVRWYLPADSIEDAMGIRKESVIVLADILTTRGTMCGQGRWVVDRAINYSMSEREFTG